MNKDDMNKDGYVDWTDSLDIYTADSGMWPADSYRVSEDGYEIVKHFEGFEPEPYYDSVGVITWGYGETLNVPKEGYITERQASEKLRKRMERDYASHVRDMVHVEITQGMFDALCSFSYNLGWGALKKSTLLKKLNSGDYEGAGEEFLRWNKAGGNVLAGLTRRRRAERAMFLGDDWRVFLKS